MVGDSISISITNQKLGSLDPARLTALLEPVSTDALRGILRTRPLGQDLCKTYFGGYRPDKINRENALKFYGRALRGMSGRGLATALLKAWLDCVPQAKAISQDVLAQDNPFQGSMNLAFYDRLAAAVSSDCISALMAIAPPVEVVSPNLPGTGSGSTADAFLDQEGIASLPDSDNARDDSSQTPSPSLENDNEMSIQLNIPASQPFSLSGPVPRPFETIVHRDRWLFEKSAMLPPLTAELQNRLIDLPGTETDSSGVDSSASYAAAVASQLTAQSRWAEAEAYWFAAAFHMAREKNLHGDAYQVAGAQVVRTCVSSVGRLTDAEVKDLAQILDTAFASGDSLAHFAAIHALLLLGTIDPSVHSSLLPQSRVVASSVLLEALPYIKRDLRNGRKDSNLIFSLAVNAFERGSRELRRLLNQIADNPTVPAILNQRQRLLETLNKLRGTFPEYDRELASKATALLGARLETYTKSFDEINEQAYESLINAAQDLLGEADRVSSHFAACFFAPLARLVGQTTYGHYQGSVRSKFPILDVKQLKPAKALEKSRGYFEIEITNSGSDAARECEILLQSPSNDAVRIDPSVAYFDAISSNKRVIRRFELEAHIILNAFSVPYQLEWRDRSGQHTRNDTLKVACQKELDWPSLATSPSPYRTQSIDEHSRLKGRDELLRILRTGFYNRTSYMITGQKRVGKTSVVKVFLTELASLPKVLSVYVPIGELSIATGDTDLGRLGWELAERISEEYETHFPDARPLRVPTLKEFRDSFNPEFARFFRQLSGATSPSLALAVDDFDELPAQFFTGDVGKAFFLALRARIDGEMSFFFVGSERLPTIIKEQGERLNQVQTIAVDYLDHQALVDLVREPSGKVLDFDDAAIDSIESWSGRNPYFATVICSALWTVATRSHDGFIVRRDVQQAVNDLVVRAEANYFQHFWSDSPLTAEEDRRIYEAKSSYVLLALSRNQVNPLAFVLRQTVARDCSRLERDEADHHIRELVARRVLEADPNNRDQIRFRVPLFALWLKQRGVDELQTVTSIRRYVDRVDFPQNEIPASDLIDTAKGLEYQGSPISVPELSRWLSQFGSIDDQFLMLKLVRHLRDRGMFTVSKFQIALSNLHALLLDELRTRGIAKTLGNKSQVTNIYVTHADADGKSGSTVVRQYRSRNKIPRDNYGGADSVVRHAINSSGGTSVIVCVDDFIGSGQSAVSDLTNNVLPLLSKVKPNWCEDVLLVYAAVVGYDDGITYIESHMGDKVKVLCCHRLTDDDKAFSPNSGIFASHEERSRAKDIAQRVGSVLEKRHPLGWENSEGLVVFSESVPNNSLPILYKTGARYQEKEWHALFPRA